MEIKIIMKNKYNPTNQIGYTCGIYCLEVANSIVTNNDINLEDYYNTIQDCIINSYTKIGEFFDINVLNVIADKFFPNITTTVYNITTIEDIKEKLDDYILIMPVQFKDTPHYCVLNINDLNVLECYNYSLSNKVNLEKIFNDNMNIVSKYIWKKSFLKTKNISDLGVFLILFMSENGKEKCKYRNLYFKNIFNKAKKDKIIKDKDTDEVNMKGKCLLVRKS